MKAAIMYQGGTFPQYTDAPEPIPKHPDEILVKVKAVALKHLDKMKASGKHYSSELPAEGGRVVGGDGVCLLEDGTRVYAMGASGMMAETATVEKDRVVPLPAGIDDLTAAALPNAVIGSAMGFRFKAGIRPGAVVLVNGATGFTGRVAVQIARHYGASKIIATGRNEQSLKELQQLGADEVISLQQDAGTLLAQLKQIHAATPIDIMMDYLWGPSAEAILSCLKGNGNFTHKTSYVSVGSMGGDLIQLSAALLRSVNLQLAGSGLGAWSREEVKLLFKEILPEMFKLAAAGKLRVDVTSVPLKDIASIWDREVESGRRLVVTIE